MTATYGQVRDVLNAAADFHRDLRAFYGRLAKQEDQQRVRMLLDYMSRHEKDFEKALAQYDQEGAGKLLDTWMHYTPEERALNVPQPESLRDDMTVDEAVDTAVRLDKELVQFYSQAAKLAKTPEVRHLFEELKERQEDQERKLKVDAVSLKRM